MKLVIEADRGRKQIALGTQLLDTLWAEQRKNLGVIGDAENPLVEPLLEPRASSAFLVILEIEIVIAPRITLCRRRMGAVGLVNHAGNHEAGNYRAVGIAENYLVLDNFFTRENDLLRSEGGFAHDAEIAPDMGITVDIGALHVKNRDIRLERAHRQQFFTVEWAVDGRELWAGGEVAALDRARRQERHARGGGLKPPANSKGGMIFHFDLAWDTIFFGAPVDVSQTLRDGSEPRSDELLHTY